MPENPSRKYYKDVWNFDPIGDRIWDDPGQHYYHYETFEELVEDPALHKTGVRIGARTIVRAGHISNRILFVRGSREEEVPCVHTAVLARSLEDLREMAPGEIVEAARSTEHKPVDLPPEEHFVALKSYVAGVAAMGLSRMFTVQVHGRPHEERVPFGFNNLMQEQVVRALLNLAPETISELLDPSLEELDGWVLLALARDPNAPAKTLSRLITSVDDDVRRALVDNPALPNTQLTALGLDPYHWVRRGIAQHRNTPLHLRVLLAGDPDFWVRRAVATSSDSPAEAILRLARDSDPKIRELLAEERELPAKIQKILVTDLRDVKHGRGFLHDLAIVINPTTPRIALNRLVDHPEANIRLLLARRKDLDPGTLDRLGRDSDLWVRHSVAYNSTTQPHILERLASELNPLTRREVAENRNTPESVLKWLAKDRVHAVRRAVAGNPLTPEEIREDLKDDPDPEVRKIVRGESPKHRPAMWKRFRVQGEDDSRPRPPEETI